MTQDVGETDLSSCPPQNRVRVRVGRGDCPSAHSWRNKAGRLLWAIVYSTIFRTSPRLCFGWRRMVLRRFGASIGKNARIDPTARIWAPWNLSMGDEASIGIRVDCYCVDRIEIGDHATVSQDVMLCTASHDITDPHMRLITARIVVASQAWVCARAFISPGVTIGEGGVVGAQSVVTRDVTEWTVVAGSPARAIKRRILVPRPVE